MSTIDFGLMLQPFPLNFPGTELFNYNRRLIRTLSPGFTTLWVEDHLQLGETATHECRDPAEIKLTYLSTASVSDNPGEVVRSPQKHFVAGGSAEVIQELERFQAVGVTHFMFRFLDPESLERFVQTVAPHFA